MFGGNTKDNYYFSGYFASYKSHENLSQMCIMYVDVH